MDDASNPLKIQVIWAHLASAPYVHAVPIPSQEGVSNGAASFDTGFPPNNFIPVATGGAGPFGNDFNGIFQQITAGLQWLQAGGPVFYDATFQGYISGYPKGAIIASVIYPGILWRSIVDNNTTNPDTAGAGWIRFPAARSIIFESTTPGSHTFTVPSGVFSIDIYATGGGGGGAGDNSSTHYSGGAGGAGGTGILMGYPVVPGQVVSITIGAGGAGGAAGGSGTDGADGGTTDVVGIVTSLGGQRGSSTANAAGGFGGSSTFGSGLVGFNAYGGYGGDGNIVNEVMGAGGGGASYWGGGGRGSTVGALINAASGAGGGGGYSGSTGSPGMAGGVVIIG